MRSAPRAYRLAVFTKNRTNPAYIGARLGADRVAQRLGCAVTHYCPSSPTLSKSSALCLSAR
jgi:ribose transport system substrate-binding protein